MVSVTFHSTSTALSSSSTSSSSRSVREGGGCPGDLQESLSVLWGWIPH